MLGLIGSGVVLPIRNRWSAQILGVGGFDAFSSSLIPTLGARVGVEWIGKDRWLQTVDVSLTTVADLGHAQTSSGERNGGVVASLAFTAGFDMRSSSAR
jgi:hypothetical protein